MAVLLIHSGPAAGQRFTLLPEGTIVGRDPGPSCQVALFDETVSGRHAALYLEGRAWVLRDLHSTNGTMVEGQEVEAEVVLRHGTRITFGTVSASFDDPPAFQPPPPTPPPTRAPQPTPQPPAPPPPPDDLLRDLRKGVGLLRHSSQDGVSYVKRLERGLGKIDEALASANPDAVRQVAAHQLEDRGDLHEIGVDLAAVFEAFEGALTWFEERLRAAEQRR